MAAHTFAPEDALPPPKSAIIYSRDGRKRSLNIDMTKHFASSIHDHSMLPPLSSHASSSANASTGVKGSTSSHSNGNFPSTNSSHKKKKKKRTKKRTLERIEESEHGTGVPNGTGQEHHTNCQHHHASSQDRRHHYDDEEEDDEDFYSDEDAYDPETSNLASSAVTGSAVRQDHQGIATTTSAATNSDNTVSGSSKKKKKKRKKSLTAGAIPTTTNSNNQHTHNQDHGNSSRSAVPSSHRNDHDHSSMVKHIHDTHTQNDGFWHYSDAEERQRIREFWFQLREEERRSLVRVEKEAVLKKMKEQQRHSCSCSLCGRKRTAIEEELELLYDAYYDELEQYANQQQPSDGHALTYSQHSPAFDVDDLSDESRPSDEEDEDEDEDDEDDEDDDEDGYEDDDEDEYEDEVNSRKAPFPYRSGFPNTLQAKGNILTVAEDLLENDGKKFLEMMDRLADRKVQRDDDLMDTRGVYEEYDDEEDGDFEEDGPEEDTLTKEQRMEEGRRMFQAFAARMFEQRVLSAYREKVAQERQERLLAELEEESRQEQLREERKEREKEKKRDKKRLQRQQKEEERAAKEALRLAEEKRQLEERERKLEADRKRREEERRIKEEEKRLRDEEKRLRDEERIKKEEERKRKLKEEKAREAERGRRRKEELLAKEKEEQERKAEEAKRLDREVYLKQRLVEEQQRQEELRQQEQLAKEELLRQEQELEQNQEQEQEQVQEQEQSSEQEQEPGAVMPTTDSRQNHIQEPVPASTMRDRVASISSEVSSASQGVNSQSPIMTTCTSPYHAPGSMSDQTPSPQGPSTPVSNSLWSNPYSTQATLQSQFQPQHPLPHQQQIFAQSMQPGMFRPPGHFNQIGGGHDAFGTRIGRTTGRGGFLSGSSHQNQLPFPTMPPLQQSSNQLPQQIGGLRSPGLAPIGYTQGNAPTKKLLTIMDPNSVASAHDLTVNSGSPLPSPSTLGAIGTPVNSFGPISPIGHTRRTSTPHGSVSAEMIKPIQRPVPIGRPKDHSQHGTISSSFDGLTLGLTGLAIGAELERKSRSPSLNLTGGSSLDQDSAALGKDTLRSTNGGDDGPRNDFSNEVVPQAASLQALSPNGRDQRENMFFTGSFFGNRTNSHDPFVHSTDFSSYGQQPQQGHRALPNSSRFMSPFPMPHPSSPHNQQQQHHPSQQQHLYLQQQQYLQELQIHQQLQQQQQLGLGSPPISSTDSWGRSSFMRPPHLNSHPPNGSPSLGVASPPSRSLSPPPPQAMSLQNSSHGPMMPIGPPSGGSSNQLHQQHQHPHQRQQPQHQFNPFPSNGLELTVGSGRKSFSHQPPMHHSNSIDGSASGMDGGLLSSASRNHVGQAMENDRFANGFPGGYGSLPHQQHQQSHQQYPLGAIGDVVNTGTAGSGGISTSGGSRDTTFSL